MSTTCRRAVTAFAVLTFALATISSADAHQIGSNNGVTVTVHVTPDDAPIVGEGSLILVPKVKTRTGTFAWATCKCQIEIANSSGSALLKGPARPSTTFTFPEAGAYSIAISGRVKRKAKWASFKVSFAIRADETSVDHNVRKATNS